ncbi:MAG: RNA recognition motif domain-containing protein [Flavipsychrobacter sp.]|mgnify:CR=1 FL=1|nr:RNA-binding protein [Bacteroidota bacterium]
MTIRVDNLNDMTCPADIMTFFAGYEIKHVSKIMFVRNFDSPIAHGYVFLDIEDDAAAHRAIEQLNNSKILGNVAGVTIAG